MRGAARVAQRRVTRGLFPVPNGSGTGLRVLLSSFANDSLSVPVWVQRVADDGSKEPVAMETVSVPARGGAEWAIPSEAVEGQTVEVDLDLDSRAVKPSVALMQGLSQGILDL